jgi:hypothetical protein
MSGTNRGEGTRAHDEENAKEMPEVMTVQIAGDIHTEA